MDYGYIFAPIEEIITNELKTTIPPKEHLLIFNDMLDEEGNNVDYSNRRAYSNRVYELAVGYSVNDLGKELRDKGLESPKLVSYKDYEEDYINRNLLQLRLSSISLIVTIILTLLIHISSTISWITRRKEELAVYYLNGSTWLNSSLICIFSDAFNLILGAFLGVVLCNYVEGFMYSPTYSPSYIAVFVVMAVLYLISHIPAMILLNSHSPIEAYRRND